MQKAQTLNIAVDLSNHLVYLLYVFATPSAWSSWLSGNPTDPPSFNHSVNTCALPLCIHTCWGWNGEQKRAPIQLLT